MIMLRFYSRHMLIGKCVYIYIIDSIIKSLMIQLNPYTQKSLEHLDVGYSKTIIIDK